MDEPRQPHFDFDEYIRQGEPEAAASAEQWQTAIGLKNRFLIINAPDNWNGTQETERSTQEKQESTQEKILDEIRNNPYTTRHMMAESIGVTPDAIKKQLDKLKAAGIIRHEGATKKGHWVILPQS